MSYPAPIGSGRYSSANEEKLLSHSLPFQRSFAATDHHADTNFGLSSTTSKARASFGTQKTLTRSDSMVDQTISLFDHVYGTEPFNSPIVSPPTSSTSSRPTIVTRYYNQLNAHPNNDCYADIENSRQLVSNLGTSPAHQSLTSLIFPQINPLIHHDNITTRHQALPSSSKIPFSIRPAEISTPDSSPANSAHSCHQTYPYNRSTTPAAFREPATMHKALVAAPDDGTLKRPASVDCSYRFPPATSKAPFVLQSLAGAKDNDYVQQAHHRAQMLSYLRRSEAGPARTVLNDPFQSGRVTGTGTSLKMEETSMLLSMVCNNLLSYLKGPDGWRSVSKF